MRREKPDGDLGDEGFERSNSVGLLLWCSPPPLLFGAVLHWSLGLLGTDEAGVAAEVRQRRLGLGCGCGCGCGCG